MSYKSCLNCKHSFYSPDNAHGLKCAYFKPTIFYADVARDHSNNLCGRDAKHYKPRKNRDWWMLIAWALALSALILFALSFIPRV